MVFDVLLLASVALAFAPSGGYAPSNVTCPSDANFLRKADSISDGEREWLGTRHNQTDVALLDFLERADLANFDAADFLDSLNRSINIGLAFSGGGYRAMLSGAGQISALDNRTTGAAEHGLGGLLQASTYLAGLSGGNWLTGTLAFNNWTSVESILQQSEIWDLEDSIFNSGGWNIFSTISRWTSIGSQIDSKEEAGFDTSLTDIWGRALSYQFFGSDNDGGAALTFSGIQNFTVFKNGSMPFPFSVAVGRAPETKVIELNSTVFEFNPFEMGSWDPSLYAFADLQYIGTNVSNGVPRDNDACVQGFDNTGFVMGTSSSLFNQFLLQLNTTGISGAVYDIINHFLTSLDNNENDVASYEPNPFFDSSTSNSSIVGSDELFLVDGGEDNQNVPFAPLLQQHRNVDVIFAFDNSADTDDNFPNGASLMATYDRQFEPQGNKTSFPYVPSNDTIIHYNLTQKPLFLGCNSSNLTDLASIPPLVVYIPNIAYTTWSNTSTFKMSYDTEDRDGMIQNGFESATRYNLTIDSNWPKCVACAIIRRQQELHNETQSDECAECFQEYCWNGVQFDGSAEPWSLNLTSPANDVKSPSNSGVVSSSSSAQATGGSSSSVSGSASAASATASGTATGSSKNDASGVWGPSSLIVMMIAPMAGFLF